MCRHFLHAMAQVCMQIASLQSMEQQHGSRCKQEIAKLQNAEKYEVAVS
jgi:hypothetical protein